MERSAPARWLRAGRVGRPHGLDGSFHVLEPNPLLLELSVADDDYGSVIGRGGRTASALRTVVKSAGAKRKCRVFLDIVDS